METEFNIDSCVRGYHVYQLRWTAVVGEELTCRREPGNASDPFAVAVIKGSEIVGHVPRSFSCICNLLLRRGGTLSCCITGNRRYSSDLPQGGLELPCSYKFSGSIELVEKIKHRLNELEVSVTDCVTRKSTKEKIPAQIFVKSEDNTENNLWPLDDHDKSSDTPWIHVKDITLTLGDRQLINNSLLINILMLH